MSPERKPNTEKYKGITTQQLRDGGEEAFIKFYTQAHGKALRFATLLRRNPTDGEDLEQIAWTQFYKKIPKIDAVNPEVYLMQIIANRSKSEFRSDAARQRRNRSAHDEFNERQRSNMLEPSFMATEARVVDNVSTAIRRLPEQQRKATVLDMMGFSKKEIAEILGITTGTLKSHDARVRTALKEDSDIIELWKSKKGEE